MNNKRYYWLKLKNDFFQNARIKKLRRIAGGDTYTIIYLKLQLLSLKDDGKIYFEGIEKTFEEELSLKIDEDADDISITLQFLQTSGLLEQINNEYTLPQAIESIGSEAYSTERSRRCREKQKVLQCNTTATSCNEEIDIEIEKEIDIELEQEQDKCNSNTIYDFIENNFNRGLTPIEYEQINLWEDNELTRYAIKQAVLNGKFNIKYIDSILQRYKFENITSVQQAQENQNQFKQKQNEPRLSWQEQKQQKDEQQRNEALAYLLEMEKERNESK